MFQLKFNIFVLLHDCVYNVGPQDAAGGLLKRQADLAVLRGQAHIQNARDLSEFAVSNLTRTKSVCRRRLFRFLDFIPREGNLSFKPISNIRSVHQVIVDNSSPHIIIRELSCFCEKCSLQIYHECVNVQKIGQVQHHEMVKETNNTFDVEEDDEEAPLSEMVSKGQVIAVYADDPDHDYFLLKVQEAIQTLNSESTDAWGSTLPAGIKVITGLYYDNINNKNLLSYKLIPRRRAVVPASAVVYICSEIDARANIVLDECVHLNILHAINYIIMS